MNIKCAGLAAQNCPQLRDQCNNQSGLPKSGLLGLRLHLLGSEPQSTDALGLQRRDPCQGRRGDQPRGWCPSWRPRVRVGPASRCATAARAPQRRGHNLSIPIAGTGLCSGGRWGWDCRSNFHNLHWRPDCAFDRLSESHATLANHCFCRFAARDHRSDGGRTPRFADSLRQARYTCGLSGQSGLS